MVPVSLSSPASATARLIPNLTCEFLKLKIIIDKPASTATIDARGLALRQCSQTSVNRLTDGAFVPKFKVVDLAANHNRQRPTYAGEWFGSALMVNLSNPVESIFVLPECSFVTDFPHAFASKSMDGVGR
jgi:hypothetical protein